MKMVDSFVLSSRSNDHCLDVTWKMKVLNLIFSFPIPSGTSIEGIVRN